MNVFAADPPAVYGTVMGTVMDPAGNTVVGARVTLTNPVTQRVLSAVTGEDGTYSISVENAGAYLLVVSQQGFSSYTQTVKVLAGQITQINPKLAIAGASASVTVSAGTVEGATLQPSQDELFASSQSTRVIDRKMMDVAGPVAGAAQIIALTPGASVTGYGNTGATKYTIGVNGVSQGWGGYGGYSGGGALSITFDGIPVVDPGNQLWQSPTIPENFMIQNTNVTYGPGDPTDRWYNNIGGQVEFTPVQPGTKAHADFSATYGSYNQKDFSANLTSGLYHGWSTVLAGGVGSGNDFRSAPDGFQNPSKDVAVLSKTIKAYQDDSFEFGGYYAHGAGYRSQVIPTVANPLITVDGQPGSKQYSQQTSGFYSTLPYNSYNKYDTNEMGLIYGRENMKLDPTMTLQNQAWFMHIARSHYRVNDVYSMGPQQDEWNSPHTETVGDRLLLTKRIPYNTINVAAYYIHAMYNSRNNFYNPADGGGKRIVNIGGKIRSSYFDQDDFAISAQDDIRFNSIVTITPGIRYVGFATGFSSRAAQDFTFVKGVTLNTTCRYIPGAGSSGNATDQAACPSAQANRSGVEPSVNASVRALPWLSLYGGFMEALRAPQMGGGGGQFQSVDPASYHLSRQSYYQAGFKVHGEGTGPLSTMLIGAAYYHQNWANQEIDITNAVGDTISSNGTSVYRGVNAYFDDQPLPQLHVFANANVEGSKYTNWALIAIPSGTVPPAGSTFNNLPAPYVPNSTINAGAYYDFHPREGVTVEPNASFQYTGTQHIFDNSQGVPSSQTMSAFGTVNLGVKVPVRFLEFDLTALNVLDRKYNEYEFISSGGYFGTSGNGTPEQGSGYTLAYPAPPGSVYGGIVAHF
ncbi:MAG: TonB-dependent receptor domain-containing protein [Acidobacteriaceae bacterium]